MTRQKASSRQRFRFGEFVLDPAARELWYDKTPVAVPPRVFDALVYLIEHRDRAVGSDELISALWGRVDVAAKQVAQLIMRARHVLGQNGDAQQEAIHTVYGFGYRWVMEVRSEPSFHRAEAGAYAVVDEPAIGSRTRSKSRTASTLRGMGWLAVATVALATVGAIPRTAERHTLPSGAAIAQSRTFVAVLPIEMQSSESGDEAWVRLGVMDLIAERLRRSGMAVSPSDGVVSALHGMSELSAEARQSALMITLDANLTIEGTATRTPNGWTVVLATFARDTGQQHRTEAQAASVVPAANRATDQLLAALGRIAPSGDDRDAGLSEVLQRAKAAILAQQIEAARDVLVNAPASIRNAPEVRLELALAEYLAGRFQDAAAIVVPLLNDPVVAADPRLHARILTIRGSIAYTLREDGTPAEKWYDAAIATLDQSSWAPELADALAVRAITRIDRQDFDAAVLDLGRARTLFEGSGNRLGLGRVEDYLGRLETARGRLSEALPHFHAAISINESLGQVRRLIASLSGLLAVQIQALRWQDALVTSERLQSMDDHVTNPISRHANGSQHATVLIALGRHDEAERVLEELEADGRSLTNVCEERARVRLAWQRGRLDEVQVAASSLLDHRASERKNLGDIALLLQRAAMAAGRIDWAVPAPGAVMPDALDVLAAAERSAHDRDEARAELLFQEAMALVERRASPAEFVLVGDAYGRWLIKRGRIPEATAVAGRVAEWSASDFDSALLQLAVFQAAGQRDAWSAALRQARKLAGQREIPVTLLQPPDARLASRDN